MKILSGFVLAGFLSGSALNTHGAQESNQRADEILDATGVRGGLTVHVGCGDGRLTAALRADDGTIVHGLDNDAGNVARARRHVSSIGLGEAVTISQFDGKKLPFIDNLVNLLVVEEIGEIPDNEIMRVLSPGGIAWIDGRKRVKARPGDIDEWTHYLYGPGNNAVAADTRVGPPRHIQWRAGPKWTRYHHKLNSVSAVVAAGGRIFYILDTATPANLQIPSRWKIIARDAFSGVLLWERPLNAWASKDIRFRSGPAQLPRLLVASGNRVYLPMGLNRAISELDAATGKTLKTFETSGGAEEVILCGDKLFVVRGAPVAEQAFKHSTFQEQYSFPNGKSIVAIETNTGKRIWETEPAESIRPLTLAADESRVYYQQSNGVICLEHKTGKQRWSYGDTGGKGARKKVSFGTHSLVLSGGVVLCNLNATVHAISADDGEKIWEQPAAPAGFHEPLDIFVIDDLVWLGTSRPDSGRRPAPPNTEDFSRALDLFKGTPRRMNTILAELQTVGHHHRCYREKATSRYIITGKRGMEFMDLKGNNHSRNNWVRGTCQYGIMPANGLTYTPPTSCGCYMASLLHAFYAFSNKQQAITDANRILSSEKRLTKGPAYGQIEEMKSTEENDWPAYRGNTLRSGTTLARAPEAPKVSWSVKIGRKLTQPIIANDMTFLAAVDTGTVYAFDADKGGDPVWHFTAGGRIDSPPTYYKGMVLFGSSDGGVYCLRAKDGSLSWRFTCSPMDLRSVSFNRVESVWPVHGSVLIHQDVAYCSAGRSTWLDKGIYLYALDPRTGNVLHTRRLESEHPKYKQNNELAREEHVENWSQNASDYKTYLQPDRSNSFSMAGGTRTDVLVSDGRDIFLHQVRLNTRLEPAEESAAHLFSTSSLLDDEENHRSHWMIGEGDFSRIKVAYSWIVNRGGNRGQRVNPYGIMLSFDARSVWGVHRNGRADGQYTVFRRKNKLLSEYKHAPDIRDGNKNEPDFAYVWKNKITSRPRAILKTGNCLVLGTHPTAGPEDDPNAPYQGRSKGTIRIINTEEGEEIATLELDSPPVWQGISAANGNIYVSTTDGTLTCITSEK